MQAHKYLRFIIQQILMKLKFILGESDLYLVTVNEMGPKTEDALNAFGKVLSKYTIPELNVYCLEITDIDKLESLQEQPYVKEIQESGKMEILTENGIALAKSPVAYGFDIEESISPPRKGIKGTCELDISSELVPSP